MLAATDNTNSMAAGLIIYGAVVFAIVRFFVLKAGHKKRLKQVGPGAGAAHVVPLHPIIATPPSPRFDADTPPARQSPIAFIRELVGPSPRKFSKPIEAYLHIKPPAWMAADDPIRAVYRRQKKIRRDGAIVWGVFVQANQLNFKPGPTDAGGSIIYSLDPYYDENPGELQAMANDLFALKGTDQADADAATFARMLTLETSRGMGLAVPRRFTGGRKVLHSAMIFPRKHLPNGYVTANILPVWTDPLGPALLPVPAAYWPASLLAFWSRVNPAAAPTPAQPKEADE